MSVLTYASSIRTHLQMSTNVAMEKISTKKFFLAWLRLARVFSEGWWFAFCCGWLNPDTAFSTLLASIGWLSLKVETSDIVLRNRGTCGKLKGIHGLLYHSYLSLVPLASLSYVMAVVGLCDMMFLILSDSARVFRGLPRWGTLPEGWSSYGRRCRDVLALRLIIISACRFAVYRGHHAQSPQ